MDDRAFSQAAIYLRNAAPEQWAAFVREWENIATQATTQLIQSPADVIVSNQGWAKCALWFLRSLKECDARVRATKPTAETPPR